MVLRLFPEPQSRTDPRLTVIGHGDIAPLGGQSPTYHTCESQAEDPCLNENPHSSPQRHREHREHAVPTQSVGTRANRDESRMLEDRPRPRRRRDSRSGATSARSCRKGSLVMQPGKAALCSAYPPVAELLTHFIPFHGNHDRRCGAHARESTAKASVRALLRAGAGAGGTVLAHRPDRWRKDAGLTGLRPKSR